MENADSLSVCVHVCVVVYGCPPGYACAVSRLHVCVCVCACEYACARVQIIVCAHASKQIAVHAYGSTHARAHWQIQ